MLFKPHEVHHEADNYDADITDAMKSVPKTSPSKDFLVTKQSNVGILAEGRRSIDIALPRWPGGIQHSGSESNHSAVQKSPVAWKTEGRVEDGVPAHTLGLAFSEKRQNFPRPLSDVDETSETESGENANRISRVTDPGKDPNKPRKSVSGTVAGFVGWKKSSKKADISEPVSTPMD